ILAWARTRNVTRLVVGRPRGLRVLERLRGSFLERLVRGSGDIDVLVVSGEGEDGRLPRGKKVHPSRPGGADEYLRAAAAVGVATAVCVASLRYLEVANLVMVYLLAIVLVALRGSRGASLFAAALSVAAFDFFCVPPRLT